MDDAVAQFAAITNSSPAVATQYLRLSEGSLENAMQLFFESGGMDLEATEVTSSQAAPPSVPQRPSSIPQQPNAPPNVSRGDDNDVIQIDSDDEVNDDNDPEITGWNPRQAPPQRSPPPRRSPPLETMHDSRMEDDEAMARRMQEELYAGGDMANVDPDGVRAPIARTTETLVGPGADWGEDAEDDMRAAIEAQMAARRRTTAGRPGIFNQRPTGATVWEETNPDVGSRREVLSQATGGASDTSSKASMLAQMYRPPTEIMSRIPWDVARQEGKTKEKWIIINVQDPSVFDCQVLNRDIWKNQEIQETVKEHFIFMQYGKDDPHGSQYIQFYFKDKDVQDAYPHIAIVDPRTGEQVKVWAGPPVPKPMDFLMQLHEFLDRYSLKVNAKNPVAKRKPEKKTVDFTRMTEEEMLEMAMQNSLTNNRTSSQDSPHDPDALTRSAGDVRADKGKEKAHDAAATSEADPSAESSTNGYPDSAVEEPPPPPSAFSQISPSLPHTEPPTDPASTTRIQFRHSGGRVIRRFALADPVRRLYEWLKADPLEDKTGVEFELVCMGRNLMDCLDETVEGAGLKNQTVMVEFLED